MLNTNGEGVAVCRCGSELHVVCSGGCPDPDVVFKSDLAAMKKPSGGQIGMRSPQRKTRILRPGICAWPNGCDLPVAVWKGRGRVPIMCPGHMGPSRAKAVTS